MSFVPPCLGEKQRCTPTVAAVDQDAHAVIGQAYYSAKAAATIGSQVNPKALLPTREADEQGRDTIEKLRVDMLGGDGIAELRS